MAEKWQNWARNLVYRNLAEVYRPESLEQLRDDVRDASRKGLKLRAVGAGHSWSRLGVDPTKGAVLRTDKLSRILSIDAAGKTVRVEGGIRLHDLTKFLSENNLALANLGDTDRQSIAGATATDTHGSGAGLSTLSEFITRVTLVTADGEVYEVPEDELKAARVSLGMLGVVYALTLSVTEKFYLRHERHVVEMRTEQGGLPSLLQENRNLEYWYYPYTGQAERLTRNEIPWAKERKYRLRNARTTLGALWADFNGRVWPRRLPGLFRRALRGFKPDVREGPSHMILPLVAQSTVDVLRTYTMEYLFSIHDLWTALDQLDESIEFAKGRGVYISLPIHIRFIQKSEKSYLSPCVHDITASFSINFSRNYDGAHTWFPNFEKRMLQLGARSHWGKMYYQPPAEDARFLEVRQRLDPQGMFSSPQEPYVPDPV